MCLCITTCYVIYNIKNMFLQKKKNVSHLIRVTEIIKIASEVMIDWRCGRNLDSVEMQRTTERKKTNRFTYISLRFTIVAWLRQQ